MSLVTMKHLLDRAEGYAVGAFNASTPDMILDILTAAEQEQAPCILQVSWSALMFIGAPVFSTLAPELAKRVSTPVAVHLDHCTDLGQIEQAFGLGFTSVMIDASRLPIEENIKVTREVVRKAHARGISVEAELGRIGGTEDDVWSDASTFTDPDEARWFVQETEVDALAVAVGTAHGIYKGEPKLDFQRLRRLHEVCDAHLVLHGASGLPDEAVTEAVRCGVKKINVATELKLAWLEGVREIPGDDPRKVLGRARERVIDVVRAKIRLMRKGLIGD